MDDYEVLWIDGSEQISQAAGVTARAMRDGLNSVAVSSDPFVRLEMLYGTFGEMLSEARVAGVRRGNCVLGVAGAVQPGHCIDSMLPEEVRTLDEPSSMRPMPIDSCTADRSWPRTICLSPTGTLVRSV